MEMMSTNNSTAATAQMVYDFLNWPMMLNLVFCIRFFENLVLKVRFCHLSFLI